jgi:hypothetical protein
MEGGLMIRAFYAAAKGANPTEVEAECARIGALLTEAIGDAVEVVPAHTEWSTHFATVGSWDGWVRDVAAGRVFPSYEPRYHMFVCPTIYVGKATAQILTIALEERKRVLLWPAASLDPQHIEAVIEDDPQNYTHGWYLRAVDSRNY